MNKEEKKEYRKQYRINHKDRINEQSKQWRENNLEKIKELNRLYRLDNPEEIKQYRKQYRKNNPEKLKEDSKQYRKKNTERIKKRKKQWSKDNIERIREQSKEWRKNNLERARKNRREYYQNNLGKMREYYSQYVKNRRKTDLKYNLGRRMNFLIWNSLKGNKAGRSWESLTGYSLADLKKRLNETVPAGFTWKDFLSGELHIDHIIPIDAFNFTRPEHTDFKRCWALSNLRLLPAQENLIKGANLDRPFQPALQL